MSARSVTYLCILSWACNDVRASKFLLELYYDECTKKTLEKSRSAVAGDWLADRAGLPHLHFERSGGALSLESFPSMTILHSDKRVVAGPVANLRLSLGG